MYGCFRAALVLAASLSGWSMVNAGSGVDWPTWRYDANRSAASPAELPQALHLQWRRRLHAPEPAFAHDRRTCVDSSYEPVIAGGRLFVPSMVTSFALFHLPEAKHFAPEAVSGY